MNLMARTNGALNLLEQLASWLAAAMLFAIMLIIAADVLLRYFFNAPLIWSYDVISLYLMVGLFFFSLSDTLSHDEHVCVDILGSRLPPRWRHMAEMITYGCASVVFAGIVYMAALKTVDSYTGNEVLSGAIAWPIWLSAGAVLAGTALLLLRMLFRFVGHAVSMLANRCVIALPRASGAEQAG